MYSFGYSVWGIVYLLTGYAKCLSVDKRTAPHFLVCIRPFRSPAAPKHYLFMKRYFLLFLLAALACSCNDSEGDTPTGTGSETQQPVSPDEILPRRLVSVDETPIGDSPSSYTFAYDEQGRLVDNYIYTDDTIVAGETTYRLQDGRVVMVRWDDEWSDYWGETMFNYDAAGYLASLSVTGNGGFEYDCAVTYAANGVLYKARYDDGAYDTLSVEFDRAHLNNLNLDFYGIVYCLEEALDEYQEALLLGVGGQRLRYLPAKVTVVSHHEEEGQWFTVKYVIRYVYHMDGDYLSEVETYFSENDEPEGEPDRIVFHYE